jgi:sugar phosphate isomerase/epimerase
MLQRTRLACYATLPDGYGFEATVAAAARAGFEEFAMWIMCVDAARAELGSLDAVADCLARHGMRISVLELLHGWAQANDAVTEEEIAVMRAAAEVFEPDVFLAATLSPTLAPGSLEHLKRECLALAPRKVALEFLPFGAVPSLSAALSIIEQVSEDNLGLVFDSWHFARSDRDYDLLEQVPGELIHFIQFNDAPVHAPEDLVTETMTARVRPGEGMLDWPRLIALLEDKQLCCPIGSEQYSHAVKAMPLDEACHYLFESVQAIVADPTYRPDGVFR